MSGQISRSPSRITRPASAEKGKKKMKRKTRRRKNPATKWPKAKSVMMRKLTKGRCDTKGDSSY